MVGAIGIEPMTSAMSMSVWAFVHSDHIQQRIPAPVSQPNSSFVDMLDTLDRALERVTQSEPLSPKDAGSDHLGAAR
jgi:hypothetical protein